MVPTIHAQAAGSFPMVDRSLLKLDNDYMGVHLPTLLLCVLKFSTIKSLNVSLINNAIITIFLHIFCIMINFPEKIFKCAFVK